MQIGWLALAAAVFAFCPVNAAMSPDRSFPDKISSIQRAAWQPGSEPGFKSRAGYPNYGPCGEVKAACRRAGFVSGGASAGIGLALDCVRPIIEGIPPPARVMRPLPQINPRLLTACRASLGRIGKPPFKSDQKPTPSYGARNRPGYETPPPRYGTPAEEQPSPLAPQDQAAPPRSGPTQDQSTDGAPPRNSPQPEDQDQSTKTAPPQSGHAPDQGTKSQSSPESHGPSQPKNQPELPN
jgi:hypothetical protein